MEGMETDGKEKKPRFRQWLREHGLEAAVSLTLILILTVFFVLWWRNTRLNLPISKICAVASFLLLVCFLVRAAPGWVRALLCREEETVLSDDRPRFARLKVLGLFALSLALYIGVVAASRLIAGKNVRFLDTFRMYVGLDSAAYYSIAKNGYTWRSEAGDLLYLVFFPGYPTLTGILTMVIPDEILCGYLAAWVPFLLSGPVLYELLRLDFDHRKTMRILILICLAPAAVFYAYPMSESLFLLFAAACLYNARKGRWLGAGILGMLASLTRSVGALLLLPMAMEWWRQFRRREPGREALGQSLKNAACLLLVPAALVLYLYINYTAAGDPLIFLQYQESNWHQHAGWFFSTAATQADYAWHTFIAGKTDFWGLWLPNLTVGFGSLLLMVISCRKMRASYTAWFLVYFCVCMGTSWLLSGPRYMAVFFPLAIAAEQLPLKRKWIVPVLAFPLAAAYAVLFALRWQVW